MLIALVVLFPLTLIKKVGHARLKRDLSLNLKIDEVSTWFEEIDEDGGGELDKAEIKLLLKRMGEGTGKKKFAKVWNELDVDKDGAISEIEFTNWYRQRVGSVPDTPYDVLFGAYGPTAYWWFMQVLWIKTGINMLFTFGYFGSFSWHLWVHLVLAASVCLMVLAEPHTNDMDKIIEMFALVSLAAVTHIASIFKSGEEWTTRYLVATLILALLPLVTTFGLTADAKTTVKKQRAAADLKRKSLAQYNLDTVDDTQLLTLDAAKMLKISVTDLEELANERGVPRSRVAELVNQESNLKENLIALLIEHQDQVFEERIETAIDDKKNKVQVAAAVASGGFLAALGIGSA